MGLLDLLNNDDARFGIGLLAAAGPRPATVGLGDRMNEALGTADTYKKTRLAQQMGDLQFKMLTQSLAAATRKNELINQALAEASGQQPTEQASDPTAALAAGATEQPNAPGADGQPVNMGGVGPTVANAQRMDAMPQPAPASGGLFAGVPRQIVATDLAFNDGKNIPTFMNTRSMPTDFARSLQQAGIDPNSPIGRQLMQQNVLKQNYIAPVNARPGSILRDPNTNLPVAFNPHIPEGFAPVFDAAGNVVGVRGIDGAVQALQQSSQAVAAGKAAVTPATGFTADGVPIATNALAMSGGGGFPASRPMASGAPAAPSGQPGTNPAPLMPQPMPGQVPFMDKTAAAAGERNNQIIKDAQDSKMRVNVLDNIIDLSRSGVATGPTTDFTNKVKGYAADAFGIKSWKNDVSGYQEVLKFMNQNANRAWQAAGGSGTDAQLAQQIQSNVNAHMFPQAVYSMAQWAKAGEIAQQAKANALQTVAPTTPQAQAKFEADWRNAMDPKVFQLKVMSPQEAQAYTANLQKTNPFEYQRLLQSAAKLKQMGAL